MIESIIKIIGSWEVDFKAFMAQLILGLAILLIFYILGRLTKHLAYKINSKVLSKHKDIQVILSNLFYYFFLLIGYYLLLKVIGLEQYFVKLLAGAGIVGIIAGFALKDIASNAFSGLLLFIKKPYINKDWIQIDGHYGKVLNVGILTTSITNKTGQVVYVSNQLIYSGVFINYSDNKKRGISIKTDVIQYFDLEKIKELLNFKLKDLKTFLATESFDVLVSSISSTGDYTIIISFWVNFDDQKDFSQTISDAIAIIKQSSIQNNIKIINTSWLSDENDMTSAGLYGEGG